MIVTKIVKIFKKYARNFHSIGPIEQNKIQNLDLTQIRFY